MEQISLDVGNRKDSDILKWLANGPRKTAMSFSGYIINGQRFHIKSIERSTQNSGVSMMQVQYVDQVMEMDLQRLMWLHIMES